MAFFSIAVILIITVAIALYVYYKYKRFRVNGEHLKQWYQTKAMIALGVFILAPGVLFLFSFRGWVDLVVGAVFAILGGIFVYYGVRSNKIIRPYAKEEVEALRSQQN
ncbi:YtpI family protein [Geomicrobium sp. JSM 1781026]|uniref:YtpI family protein n=1 Tax=Geomicrobium sp. JSM 1781026 TaxID=3344580 RepID=UPI0035C0F0AB